MTEPPALGAGDRLDFANPLSADRADRMVARLAAARPSTVVDYGCGWGELLLRVLDRCPRARGTGLDVHGPDIERARRAARDRGLDGRVEFVEGSAADHRTPADAVISLGAYQAFGTTVEALEALAGRVKPGGRLLFGAEVWTVPPSPERLAHMWAGASTDDCVDLATLADQAVAAGFRLLRVETATLDEWDAFEFGLTEDVEEWLLANPTGPHAAGLRSELDGMHHRYLHGTRGVLGLAYLTLGRRG
ncbi:SAM-dependent methyltransferase [Virgisporangium ochraceum]|uniref:SAM-dependent methyltransferase n=1 Tax=Virgisporangium ochraceum TaxID=65505 RepID=A0A8J4E848_9ACTN|nr:class I SAM-dependent methyltransferase [Virgisporangium ochraceum]GIJ65246.1 SAM-dependent methyltransferase [Virgisporangium ochraceum]